MATDDPNFVGLRRGTRAQRLRNCQKPMIFAIFWPGVPTGAADSSSPCGPCQPKFYVMSGLGYGYRLCEFCWALSRYSEAAFEKLVKTVKNCNISPFICPGCPTARLIARPPCMHHLAGETRGMLDCRCHLPQFNTSF